MNFTSEKLFDRVISILNKMGIPNEDIIVTGSVALDIYGVLPDDHEIHDFDCIIKTTDANKGIFNLMFEIFKSDKLSSSADSKMLDINGILINIWTKNGNSFKRPKLTYKGVGVKDLYSILVEKKKYGRAKDYKDINGIVKKIIN